MDIELKHIHKRFGRVHANNDISVRFDEGRIIGVLGENGAGKSTLMKILSGYQPATSGEVCINGAVVDYIGPLAAISAGIGMLQQDPLDVGAFTVLENFAYGLRKSLVINRRQARKILQEIIGRLGFDLDPDSPIESLTVARRQQLEIARLLALGIQTLILDEPTTGISQEQKEILFRALKDLVEQDRMTVLLVSHKLEDVIALCDEVIVLRAGQLIGTREMPATTEGLVTMMFGQQLDRYERETVQIGDPVLELKDVRLRTKRLEMNDISFQLHAGEVVGLAGLDGSGQQPFMRAFCSLEKLYSGDVLSKGDVYTGRSYLRFMEQGITFAASGRLEEGLIAGLTLTEHMALVSDTGIFIQWAEAARKMRIGIDRFRVRGAATDHIEQLSGGNQQRVLMTLLPEQPTALILEQPTRGLDVESAQWIWQQLLEKRQHGTAIMFSSAELEEIVAYSDRILVFFAGHVYEIPDASTTNSDELGYLIGGGFMERTGS